MCGAGVESPRVESGGSSCSVNAFFLFVGICFKCCCICFDPGSVCSGLGGYRRVSKC